MTLSVVERLVFRHFFDGLALGGAVAEWGLLCWLVWPLGLRPPLWAHAGALLALAVMNRLAARPVEDIAPGPGPFDERTGYVVLACAFGALVAAGALVATAALWLGAGAFATLRAEAGGAALAAVEPLLGSGFRILGTGVVTAAAAAVAHGYRRGYRAVETTTLHVPLPGAPDLRLVHVSDFHLGPMADRAAVRAFVDRILVLTPDVICVGGDLVDSPATDLDAWIPELGRLRAPLGVYAILGNHDRHVGTDAVLAALRRHTDWRVLRDEAAAVEAGGRRLWLLGLEDRPESQKTDGLPALLAQAPLGEPAILLAHRPSVFPAAAAAGIPLVLAGHTHGGQLALPGVPRLNVARLLGTRFAVGRYRLGASLLHVSRGLGTSGQPIRIAAPCEITVVRVAA